MIFITGCLGFWGGFRRVLLSLRPLSGSFCAKRTRSPNANTAESPQSPSSPPSSQNFNPQRTSSQKSPWAQRVEIQNSPTLSMIYWFSRRLKPALPPNPSGRRPYSNNYYLHVQRSFSQRRDGTRVTFHGYHPSDRCSILLSTSRPPRSSTGYTLFALNSNSDGEVAGPAGNVRQGA